MLTNATGVEYKATKKFQNERGVRIPTRDAPPDAEIALALRLQSRAGMRWLILSLALLVAAPAHAENTRRKHAGQALTGVGIGLTVVSIMLGAARQYSWDHNGGRPACCDDVAGPIEFGMAFGLAGAGSAVTSAGIPMWLTARF